jgi:hypothetical protein
VNEAPAHRCSGCGAPIRWAWSAKKVEGKPRAKVPLDYSPVEVEEWRSGLFRLEGQIAHGCLKADGTPEGLVFVGHFGTCPERAQFRRGAR